MIKESKVGRVVAVCISEKKGTQKEDVGEVKLIKDCGVEGDAHAGPGHRQVSLLALESANVMKEKGLDIDSGDFGENIVTEGLELKRLRLGTRLKVGRDALLEITQIGKECHDRCAIYYTAGDCIMPREGIFGTVQAGGIVRVGDEIKILD
ncbi:MAG TPA: MOSC domain-containing protein [Candidatus Avalokitesvara rifleensis]|uniref:MOSC domain-containing protein n=1 Tax=Candidatus Avalokitesvara rifleensis TaxID=3367620 RepID=UPI0027139294|nr:MOSC domain-containing protein [Candidatus Brocadiales bacterium]